MPLLLLIGDTSVPEALGSKLLKGFSEPQASQKWKVITSYTSPARAYSPSMKSLRGKIFYRLADKRSWEWWNYQKTLLELIKQKRPGLVLVTGVLPLQTRIFDKIHEYGGKIVNYLTDDPWNPIHKRNKFISNLKDYDHIFSTKDELQRRLKTAGCCSTSWLPFAYDPTLHYPVDEPWGKEIVFIGTGARERLPWLEALSGLSNTKKTIYGNSWESLNPSGWEKKSAVMGREYCRTIMKARIVLGLVRKANGDQSTDRSYEIGAIGGCGLYQDTAEHRKLLKGYPEAGFFSGYDDLKQKVLHLLEQPTLQKQLRDIGQAELQKREHTYAARLSTILEWFDQ